MGNCFGFLKDYNTKPIYNSNAIPVSSIPIGTPIYFDTSNNNYTNHVQNQYNPQNPNNPNIIVINQQPYYDNGLSTMNGFFTGMLMGELLNDDCI
jgi:hypothetical protein